MNTTIVLMLIRREFWENRSLWIAPLVLAGSHPVLRLAFGGIHVGAMASTSGSRSDVPGLDESRPGCRRRSASKREASTARLIASRSRHVAADLGARRVVVFFYLLDACSAERKDRSILFWKSLPISDTQVVLSKLLIALVRGARSIVLVLSAVTQLLFGASCGCASTAPASAMC